MQPFFTSLMGSMPRSQNLMRARRLKRAGRMSDEQFEEILYTETEHVVKFQENLGLDVIVSGELARDNYVSFISEKIGGVTQMSMADMMDYVEDKQVFDEILNTLDVPAVSIKNAICTGPLTYSGDIVLEELKLLKSLTSKPVKITLPGPYLVTRSMWLSSLSTQGYPTKEALGEAVLDIYRQELDALTKEGVDIIQFDEPVLTEVVFSAGKTRTFMCASLSQKKDPTEELKFASHLIGEALSYIDRTQTNASLHVCRGNWSRDESILLTGPYTPLIELFSQTKPDLLALEYSTPRAGELTAFLRDERIFGSFDLGLGVLNPRLDEAEDIGKIVARGCEAADILGAQHIALNPDCGFATFSNRPVNSEEHIAQKVTNMVRAAQCLRERYA